MLKKKIWASFQRIIEIFTQKFVSSLKYGFGIRDPDPQKTYSRSRIQGVKKALNSLSGSALLVYFLGL